MNKKLSYMMFNSSLTRRKSIIYFMLKHWKGKKTMREAKITRTFKTTKVSVLCLDVVTAEPQNIDLVLPSTYENEEKAMKAVKVAMASEGYPETLKPVSIADAYEVEELYGMPASVFIAHAEKLPPREAKTEE